MQTVSFSGNLAEIKAQILEFIGLTEEQYEEALKPTPAPTPWPFPTTTPNLPDAKDS